MFISRDTSNGVWNVVTTTLTISTRPTTTAFMTREVITRVATSLAPLPTTTAFHWNTTAFNSTQNSTISTNTTTPHHKSFADLVGENPALAFAFAIAIVLSALVLGACCDVCCCSRRKNTKAPPDSESTFTSNTNTYTSPRSRSRSSRRTTAPGAFRAELSTSGQPPAADITSRPLTAVAPIPMTEIGTAPPAYEVQRERRISEDIGNSSPPPLYRTQTRDGERVIPQNEVEVPAPVYSREWGPREREGWI